MNTRLSYCGDLVRGQDPDRFLLSMFEKAERRVALWAVFAFNHEIAKTREVVSETQLGLIRLQWWRDRIAELYAGHVEEHEVLKALACAIETYDLPKDEFDTLIYAREFDLEDVLPGNVEGLLNYADFTHTPLLRLVLKVLGSDAEMEPVQPVAVNYALAGILRSVPFHAQQRRCYLPEDLMKAHGQRMDHLYEFKPAEGVVEIVQAVAEHNVRGLKPDSGFLKRMDRLSQIYFRQLQACGYDVFDARLSRPPAFKVLRLIL